MTAKQYPAASPHDPIRELFPGVWWVHGSVRVGPGLSMNRNMLILGQDGELTLVNPVRLNDAELTRLEQLGRVRHVLRLGDFHGMDDAFYIDRYGAEFWCQPGQETYKLPEPRHAIVAAAAPPLRNAQFFVFATATCPEAALLLRDHGLLITTDALQNHVDWSYCTLPTKLALGMLGFRIGLLVGPPWRKRVTPKGGSLRGDFEKLLELDFDHLIAAHGGLLRGGAKAEVRRVVEETFG